MKKIIRNKFVCPTCGHPALPIIMGESTCEWRISQKDLDREDCTWLEPSFDSDDDNNIKLFGIQCSCCRDFFTFDKNTTCLDDVYEFLEKNNFIKSEEVDETKYNTGDDMINIQSGYYNELKKEYIKYIEYSYSNVNHSPMPEDIDRLEYAKNNNLYNMSEFVIAKIKDPYNI